MCIGTNCNCGCGPSVLTLPTGSTGSTGSTAPIYVSNTIFVSKLGSDSTGTPERLDLPFLTIGAAITAANAFFDLSSPIRRNIVVFGGTYTENVSIPYSYINLISGYESPLLFDSAGYSVVSARFGTTKGPVNIAGTITVTADTVSINGINCITLAQNIIGTNCQFSHMIVSSAITTNNANPAGSYFDVHSNIFLSLPSTGTLKGYYEKCTGGSTSFAGNAAANAGNINGVLIDCVGTTYSFASANANNGGTISSAKLIRCKATGSTSFASSTSGTAGTITDSELIDCESEATTSFASSGNSTAGSIEGSRLIRCKGTTKVFFYGNSGSSNFSTYFEDCYAEGLSYGSGPTTAGTLDGYFLRCTDLGDVSFGSSVTGTAGTLSGEFVDCLGGYTCFASVTSGGTAGTISGRMYNCHASSQLAATPSFASNGNGTGGTAGTISGYLINCKGVDYSFCSTSGTGGTVSGKLINCVSETDFMLYKAVVTGAVIGARINTGVVNAPAIIVATGARLTNCALKGDGTATSIHATSAANISATYCRTFGKGTHANVTNLVTTPFIIDDSNDVF